MTDVQLFAVTSDGPQRAYLPQPPSSIHDLPPDLPYGVYTVFRTFEHNKFLGLADHLARIEQSAALLGWEYRLDKERLRLALHRVCSAYEQPEARVRIDVLAAAAPQLGIESRVLITLAPFTPVPAACYEEGVRLSLAPRLRRSEPRAKQADFVLARRDYPRQQPDAFDYLLLDENGHVLEASTSNFYAVRQGTVWTADDGVLEGITRKIVLRLIADLAIPLRLEAVPLQKIGAYDEAFLSSSSRGLVPVVAVAGQELGAGRPGPLTRRLMRAYERYVAREIRPAVGV